MKIAIDLQGCQNQNNRYRGIGRYSLSVIKNLIRDRDDQFILVSNANLPNISSDFNEELSATNSKVTYLNWIAPGPFTDRYIEKGSRYSIAVQIRSFMIRQLSADVIFISSFFEVSIRQKSDVNIP